MENSSRLTLPYIMPSQAQKHVTHNEALRMLDALVQPCVETLPTDAPPEAPVEGMVFAIADSASGDWIDKANMVAAFQDGAWTYFTPRQGWQFFVKDDNSHIIFDGSQWVVMASDTISSALSNLGINAGSDADNRFVISSANSLFSHEGGNHQVKINKASETDTASVVFQNDFSGRAEIGLVGDDELIFKTSSNGQAFDDVFRASASSGKVQTANIGINKMPDTNLHVYAASTTATMRIQSGNGGTFGSPFADLSHDGSSFYFSNWGAGNIAFTAVRAGTSVTFGTSGQTRVRISDAEFKPEQDSIISLGSSSKRWSDIWAVNGVVQTSDERDKTIHHRLFNSGKMVDHVEPISFNWKEDNATEISNAGFIAQEISDAQSNLGYQLNVSGKTEEGRFWIKPDQLLAVLWQALRETRQQLAKVEEKLLEQ